MLCFSNVVCHRSWADYSCIILCLMIFEPLKQQCHLWKAFIKMFMGLLFHDLTAFNPEFQNNLKNIH